MSGLGNQSSTVWLTVQTKNPTYTPEVFDKAIKDLGYMASQANAQISTDPNQPPVPTIIYSKGNLMVLTNYGENLIRFIIINSVDLNQFRESINQILDKLQVVPHSIHTAELQCKTEIPTPTSPIHALTSLINENALRRISNVFKIPNMEVMSLAFANSNWENGELRIVCEPFAGDPENQFWLVIVYRTRSLLELDKFLQVFTTKMVENIISSIRQEET